MSLPTIQRLRSDQFDTRYRAEGGELAENWRALLRPGESAWCEFTVLRDGTSVGSYGGSVWPTAWPALFRTLAPTAQVPNAVKLTGAGLRWLASATGKPQAEGGVRRG